MVGSSNVLRLLLFLHIIIGQPHAVIVLLFPATIPSNAPFAIRFPYHTTETLAQVIVLLFHKTLILRVVLTVFPVQRFTPPPA